MVWDHPRVCGKDVSVINSVLHGLGSPPRMRERLKRLVTPSGRIGITPAYAGKTRELALILHLPRDHPRVCGKDSLGAVSLAFCLGSPPRMRERLIGCGVFSVLSRITPAYAGKTECVQ